MQMLYATDQATTKAHDPYKRIALVRVWKNREGERVTLLALKGLVLIFDYRYRHQHQTSGTSSSPKSRSFASVETRSFKLERSRLVWPRTSRCPGCGCSIKV